MATANVRKGLKLDLPSERVDWKKTLEIRSDTPKQTEFILFIAEKMKREKNFGKTVLAKLMYFSETNYFLKKGTPIAGTVFVKGPFGPIPKNFDELLGSMEKGNLIKIINIKEADKPERKSIFPLREPETKKFSEDELSTIEDVIKRLNMFSAKQISDYSHTDVAWQWTDPGKEIDYRLTAYREIECM